jgi:predicted  nucleic acid-binding Zn-ribbon protein
MTPNLQVLKERLETNNRQFEERYAKMSQNDPQKLRMVPNIQVLKKRMDDNNKQFKEGYAKCMEKYGNH